MSSPVASNSPLAEIARASRRAGVVSALGGAILLGSLLFATVSLRQTDAKLRALDSLIVAREKELEQARTALDSTQAGMLSFIADLSRRGEIQLLDSSVDWDDVQEHILAMPPGRRRNAVLSAILYAWKTIPFGATGNSAVTGFNSPRFALRVLEHVGIKIDTLPGVQLIGPQLLRRFPHISKSAARLGDLMVFQWTPLGRGTPSTAVLMLLAPGRPQGYGIGIGMLNTGAPVQVIDTSCEPGRNCPYLGTFVTFLRVPYETPQEGGPAE
jgi:hypothetical protein